MHPILAELEFLGRSVPVQSYGVATFAALFIGLAVAWRTSRRIGLDPDHLLLGVLLLLPLVLAGAKLLPLYLRGELWATVQAITGAISANEHPARAATAWVAFFLMPGGSTVGAALGGGLGLLAYVRYFRLPLGDVLDALAPALALGLPLLRLGCLAAGCCFGAATQVPWAVVYNDPRAELAAGVPLGIHLHPSPLYEALAAAILGAILLRQLERRQRSGQVFAAFVIGYGTIRLLLAPMRGDAAFLPGAFAWMAAITAGLAGWLWLRDRGAKPSRLTDGAS